jgi:hypothetical protein
MQTDDYTIFVRSNTGVVGSNPTRGMDAYVWSYEKVAAL